MKSTALLSSCLAALQIVYAQQNGFLYAIDRKIQSSSTSSIDTDTASSILARRRGLTDSRYLRTNDERVLAEINTYGGHQQPLFGEEAKGEAPAKLFIRVSDFNGDIMDLRNSMPDLWIENPTRDLQDDFGATTSKRQDGLCEYKVPASLNARNSKGIEVVFTYPLNGESSCLPAKEIPYIPVIMSVHAVLPNDAAEVPTKIGQLVRVLKHLSATENIESTLLLLPSKMAKSNSKHQSEHHHQGRAAQSEETLDVSSVPASTPVQAAASSVSVNLTLPSVIPDYFKTQADCNRTTNNCSGHGLCYEAYANHFKCKCGSTVKSVTSGQSNQTVQWGGNACQKKDISVPFLLFAGIGITLTALIAGGLGLLYSMGSQELPSVLGAGVAGPRAQR